MGQGSSGLEGCPSDKSLFFETPEPNPGQHSQRFAEEQGLDCFHSSLKVRAACGQLYIAKMALRQILPKLRATALQGGLRQVWLQISSEKASNRLCVWIMQSIEARKEADAPGWRIGHARHECDC